MAQELVKTDDLVSEAELKQILGDGDDDDIDDTLPEVIQTCAGEWRAEGDKWRFWQDPDWEE